MAANHEPRVGSGTGRQWSTTEGVRSAFLHAARQVFAEHGFTDTSVTDVVERAGLSVGSLYYHFGSKTDLFIELWHRYLAEHRTIVGTAVAAARDNGTSDPFELFLAGSRAYLHATWRRRDLVGIFELGDVPPGFHEIQRREGRQQWVAHNFRLLGANDNAVNRVLVALLTSFLGEARREVTNARSAKEAGALVDAMIDVLARMRPVMASNPAAGLDDRANI